MQFTFGRMDGKNFYVTGCDISIDHSGLDSESLPSTVSLSGLVTNLILSHGKKRIKEKTTKTHY